MVCFGYLRVSTEKQAIDNNKNEIEKKANELGFNHVIWISETVSGRKSWEKRKLGEEFNNRMKAGDTIIMAEYSRIGRDFLNSMSFIAECRKKKINVVSVIGDIPLNNDANSNLLMAVGAWKAQTERELIAYRTKVGLDCAKKRGVKLGRKSGIMKLDNDPINIERIREDINIGVKQYIIAKKYNCSTITLRKFIKKHNINEKNSAPPTELERF
jgi:DNA invertase Pin-like site-specific DNA recombinase